jgi:hypothetical protein
LKSGSSWTERISKSSMLESKVRFFDNFDLNSAKNDRICGVFSNLFDFKYSTVG